MIDACPDSRPSLTLFGLRRRGSRRALAMQLLQILQLLTHRIQLLPQGTHLPQAPDTLTYTQDACVAQLSLHCSIANRNIVVDDRMCDFMYL